MKEKIISILRYIFAIPLAIVGCFLGTLYFPYLFLLYVPGGSIGYNITFYVLQSVAFVLMPLAILYTFPPKKHFKIISAIGIIYCILWAITIILEIIFSTFDIKDLGNCIIQTITIICYILHMATDPSRNELNNIDVFSEE